MLSWVIAHIVGALLTIAGRPATRRRRASSPAPDDINALLAQLTSIDPGLEHDTRCVSRSVVALVGLLEVELSRFRNVEERIDRAVSQWEESAGVRLDDEQLTRLSKRLGVRNVRPALQRVERAHPDTSEERGSRAS